ncbi:MAG: hypothetical protein IPN22_11000 [Bacteroidetes bacterium]|nr:hypothetical protein [Bacteroidota bacterium]
MHDYPNSYGLFKPRTINDLKAEEAVQSGGKDAVLGLGAGVAAPFVAGYGTMYYTPAIALAKDVSLQTYVYGNLGLEYIRSEVIWSGIVLLAKQRGWMDPTVQALIKQANKTDPLLLMKTVRALLKIAEHEIKKH